MMKEEKNKKMNGWRFTLPVCVSVGTMQLKETWTHKWEEAVFYLLLFPIKTYIWLSFFIIIKRLNRSLGPCMFSNFWF
jgi:hypothetical protein